MAIGDMLDKDVRLTREAIAAENRRFRNERIDELVTQAARTWVLMNSGAILATLGFLQALAGKEGPFAADFKCFGLGAMAIFMVGTLAAANTHWLRAMTLLRRNSNAQAAGLYLTLSLRVALAAFLLGASVVGYGVYEVF